MYHEFLVKSGDIKLYCRRQGKGVPLLLIHGACVDSNFFRDCAEELSSQFTVISYDRRGYGRSADSANENYSFSSQAEDAAQIIYAIGQSCHIIAHSAGSLIAMELAISHPDLVHRIFLYEPAVLDCLPDGHKAAAELKNIHNLIQNKKYVQAFSLFIPMLGERDERARAATEEELTHMQRNSLRFIRNEFVYWYTNKPEYETLSRSNITIGVGELSRDSHHWPIAKRLSEKLSSELMYFPGAHNCAYDLPKEFSYLVAAILKH